MSLAEVATPFGSTTVATIAAVNGQSLTTLHITVTPTATLSGLLYAYMGTGGYIEIDSRY